MMTNCIYKLFRQAIYIFTICFVLVGCNGNEKHIYQGYVEGEVRYLASPYSGILQNRLVHRGQQVKAGDLLFKLDMKPELYHLHIAENALTEGQSTLKNMIKPKRQPVIKAIKEQIEQIDAELSLAKLRQSRFQKLYEKNAASQDNLDEVKSQKERLLNKKEELMAELQLAQMGERSDVIEAQKEKLKQLQSDVQKNKWIVHRTYAKPI